MARKIKAKLVLRLRAAGHSRNSISRTQGMAKRSVCEVCDAADQLGVTYDDVADMDDDKVYALLFPGRHRNEQVYESPDWDEVHKELGRTGVTLSILHAEYLDACSASGGVPMSYATFCRGYRAWAVSEKVTSRVDRKAGRSVEVDWSGPTMAVVDPCTGEVATVYLFVASLPFSRYDYVEPTLDMKQNTWLMCHVHMFEFYGGSVPRIVPDNLKTGVVKHPREGEIVLNESYRDMAAHYGAAVLPARLGAPKDKPSAEGSVGNVARDVIAELRNVTFTSFDQLKQAVAEKLEKHNSKPFQKREGSRLQCFLGQEAEFLQPLPPVPYEVCTWAYGRKVALDCHVSYAKNHYSCPWQHVGKKVDLRVTDTVLEVYLGTERIATHPVFPAYVSNGYSTRESDLPEDKAWREWDSDRIRAWAERVGPACSGCVNRIFESVKFDEQGFDAALAVLRLTRKYPASRVEKACSIALCKYNSPRYRHIKAILDAGLDKADEAPLPAPEDGGGYVRGADYYGGGFR